MIMKKLILICFLLLFVAIANAQENKKSKWSELNQDQLNLALKHSSITSKAGMVLTFAGGGAAIIDFARFFIESGGGGKKTYTKTPELSGFFYAGLITLHTGIPLWIVGSIKKNIITLELVKFNTTGSASINGIGLKIRF
jgi:hypothetical protein